MIHFDCDSIFSFKIPDNLLKEISNLETAINNNESYVDCIQDEIRSWAHGYSYDTKEDALLYGGITEEEAEEIITYFCRRRF